MIHRFLEKFGFDVEAKRVVIVGRGIIGQPISERERPLNSGRCGSCLRTDTRSDQSIVVFRLEPIVCLRIGMIGYGAAKAATIHIGRSLAAENSGLPTNASVVTIAP